MSIVCREIREGGLRCNRYALRDSDYCQIHKPDDGENMNHVLADLISEAEARGRAAADEVLAQLQDQLLLIIEALQGAKNEMDTKVLAERERCAKIAESIEDSIAEAIAERIRSGE